MTLFEKNLEVLKKWNGKSKDESNIYWHSNIGESKFNDRCDQIACLNNLELRLKPEPQYRPYKNIAEIESDGIDIYKLWLRNLSNNIEYPIQGITRRADCFKINHEIANMNYIFNKYVNIDGTPFGNKVD
jgi:hypothetical protein